MNALHLSRRWYLVAALVASLATPVLADVPHQETRNAAVAVLRDDYKNERKFTGFMSAGSAILYGLDYLEAKKPLEASWRFEEAIRTDDKNALAYFLLGEAKAALGEWNRAKMNFNRAVELDSAYEGAAKAQLAAMAQAQKAAAAKANAAKKPTSTKPATSKKTPAKVAAKPSAKTAAKPAAKPAGKVPSTPPLVTYMCYHIYFSVGEGRTKFDYKGMFTLMSGGRYRWLKNGPIGRYSYSAQTKRITFLSGHLKQPGLVATYGPDEDGKTPQIELTFNTDYTRRTGYTPIIWQCTPAT